MSDALTRNRFFDGLIATPGLAWMGQNTNHIPAHPAVKAAMIAAVEGAEFNAYAPPLGFEALRAAIVADLGVTGAEALVTEGGVNRSDLEMAMPVCPSGRCGGHRNPDLRRSLPIPADAGGAAGDGG